MTVQIGPERTSEFQNPLEAVKRSWRIAGVQAAHLTGRYGYDPITGLPVAETSNQPIQAAKDRVNQESGESK